MATSVRAWPLAVLKYVLLGGAPERDSRFFKEALPVSSLCTWSKGCGVKWYSSKFKRQLSRSKGCWSITASEVARTRWTPKRLLTDIGLIYCCLSWSNIWQPPLFYCATIDTKISTGLQRTYEETNEDLRSEKEQPWLRAVCTGEPMTRCRNWGERAPFGTVPGVGVLVPKTNRAGYFLFSFFFPFCFRIILSIIKSLYWWRIHQ